MNPKYRFFLQIGETNKFSPSLSGTATGYWVQNTDGELVANAGYNTTGYIPVKPGYYYYISNIRSSAFYDANRNYVSGFVYQEKPGYIRVPAGVTYMRNSVLTTEWANFSVYERPAVFPIYKDDLAKDYELETNQRFYRSKLSGKISFVRDDYDLINNAAFSNTFFLYIERSDDWGKTWISEFTGKFQKTDCTFNDDDKKVQVQIDVVDEYNDVLAGLEKEYNLIAITPEIERILVKKRPLIQVYIPGDSIVSCFLGGTFWEQDANATTDRTALVNTYHFALCNLLKEINVTGSTNPNVNALYSGRMSITGTNIFTGSLYPNITNGYYIYISQQAAPPFWGLVTVEIRRSSDNVAVYRYTITLPGNQPWDNADFDAPAVAGTGATGSAHCEMATYNIYVRYLLDVDTIQGLNTYELPSDDIVDYNRNYRRVIGYAIDVAYISNRSSTEPTEWGRRDDGTYFQMPYSIWGQQFYPIARSTWRYASIWFAFYLLDEYLEKQGRKTYTLRDAFPVGSCIQSLLNQFAPGITHKETPEYSQFLYNPTNPVSGGQNFRLFVTQKSNILVGDYQQPAQKAPTTLQQFTNMLRDCFQCYWYIEDGKFKIEHIVWFRNGGSYTGSPVIGTDLTTIENIRNGKKWGFNTSEWSFDKVDMPERFQFKWMDDVTLAFEGMPIEVKSKYVTAGKIEEINISNFTSDVDMMMLNPGSMSNDGFALFAALPANALAKPDENPGFDGSSGTNGYSTPRYDIRPECVGRAATLMFTANGENGKQAQICFFNSAGNQISAQGVITFNGSSYQSFSVTVNIPTNAASVAFYVNNGTASFYVYNLAVSSQYELPFGTINVSNVEYVLQNVILAFMVLQPTFWVYNLPARDVVINGNYAYVQGIERKKKQTLNFPVTTDPNPVQLIKTYIGNGQIDKMSVNLQSRMSKTTLKYDTE